MSISLDPKIEARIRERTSAEGMSISDYIERLIDSLQSSEDELEALALEGLSSGQPIEGSSDYWEEKRSCR